MLDKFVRLPTVIEATGRSRTSIYADMAEGTFPRSIAVGKNAIAWLESEIEAWMNARIADSRATA